MNKLIIATHGYMAKGIKSALAIIAGDLRLDSSTTQDSLL